MRRHGQSGFLSVVADRDPCRLAAQGLPPLAHKEGVRFRIPSLPLGQPGLDCPYLVHPQRVRGRESFLQSRHMQDAAFNIHLGHFQSAGLGHPQPVPEHEQEQAPVAGLVPATPGGGNQAADFGQNEVFSVVHHFV